MTQSMPMIARSRQETAPCTCPACGAAFEAAVWMCIDAQERPDLRQALIAGTLHQARCPHCGAAGRVSAPLLYHDGASEQLLLALPLSVGTAHEAEQLAQHLHTVLLADCEAADLPAYMQHIELVPDLEGLQHALATSTIDDPHTAQLHAALHQLIVADSGEEFRQVLVRYRPLLMAPEADDALEIIINEARAADDREYVQRAIESRATLNRFRTTLVGRRGGLALMLDQLAPLTNAETQLVPVLKTMLDAVDPQEVYAARIGLNRDQQTVLDTMLDRLIAHAQTENRDDLEDFLLALRRLHQQ